MIGDKAHETAPGAAELRDQMARVLYESTSEAPVPWAVLISDPDYAEALQDWRSCADAALAIVQPLIDRAETGRAIAVAQHSKTIGPAEDAEQRAERAEALLRELVDPDPCDHFDHHGHCQTHGAGDPCPHARAKNLLATLDAQTPPDAAVITPQPPTDITMSERTTPHRPTPQTPNESHG